MSWGRRALIFLVGLIGLLGLTMAAWAVAIGPEAMWRVLTHGTTTVWDHLEYPGRSTTASPFPLPWATRMTSEPMVSVEGEERILSEVLAERDALSFLVVQDGSLVYEWYAPDHDSATPSMLFSASKSVTSLLVGAAIEDELIEAVSDPVSRYVPELTDGGFDQVSIEDLLRMDSNSTYVESDNPFGVHVEFNYSADLEADILGLGVRDEPDIEFTYKSGDNAILGLILDRVLAPASITDYLQSRLLDPMGAEDTGIWSTDDSDGLERTWCCLALTARDFARFGQLALDRGNWNGTQLLPADWFEASFTPGYTADEWPADYDASRLTNYGYQWWLVGEEAVVAIGKDGQYLYVDFGGDLVIVRTGTSQGGIGWVDILAQLAERYRDGTN